MSPINPCQEGSDVDIALLDSLVSKPDSAGVGVYVSESEGHAQYVQSHEEGVRLLSVLDDAQAKTSFSYEFTSEETDLDFELQDGGAYLVLDDTGIPVGTISEPWAMDANQNPVPTWYEFAGDTLTQVVDTSAVSPSAYPVVADPNWTYSLVYRIGKTTAQSIFNELHRCFNCNFPVAGAPARSPVAGQVLPLTVLKIGNFKCKMGISYINTQREQTGFQFEAMAGHIDGAGSIIGFEFYRRYTDNNMVLAVNAFVIKDFIGGNTQYVSFAGQNWGQFAGNIIRNVNLPVPPQEPPVPPSS